MIELAWRQLSIKQINDQASPMPINPYHTGAKKQSSARRTLIGRTDRDTGEIIPTDGRNRKKQAAKVPAYLVMSGRESRFYRKSANCFFPTNNEK
jgi:hypothetical protein